jgi:hypothetical protein
MDEPEFIFPIELLLDLETALAGMSRGRDWVDIERDLSCIGLSGSCASGWTDLPPSTDNSPELAIDI